jgi:hypothetical protein
MPADEAALRPQRGDHLPLHRADVGDGAVLRRRIETLGRQPGQGRDRGGAEDQLGALHRGGHALGRDVDRFELGGALEQLRVWVETRHLGVQPAARGQADRASDQADAEDGDPHRASAASANTRPALASENQAWQGRRKAG